MNSVQRKTCVEMKTGWNVCKKNGERNTKGRRYNGCGMSHESSQTPCDKKSTGQNARQFKNPMNNSHELSKNNTPFTAANVNIFTNELFTAAQTATDLLRKVSSGQEHFAMEHGFFLDAIGSTVVDRDEIDRESKRDYCKNDLLPNNSLEYSNSTRHLSTHPCHKNAGEASFDKSVDSSVNVNNSGSTPVGIRSDASSWSLKASRTSSLTALRKSTNDEGICCRICHSGAEPDGLVTPCLCTGSVKYVHESCLLNWLKSSIKTKCELCLHEVPVKKSLKPFREWRLLDEKPIAIIWLVSFFILLTLNILSVVKDASRGCKSSTCIVFYVLGCTGAVLGLIFLWFWAKKSAVYFKKLLTLNQVWTIDYKNTRCQLSESVVVDCCKNVV